MRIAGALAGAVALVWSAGAHAQVFCWRGPYTVCDGCEATTAVRVVASTVPRPPIPGRPADRPWCGMGFRSLGGTFRKSELVERPTLGVMEIGGVNFVRYKSDRVGRDRAVVRHYWNSRTGREESATVVYDIEVVGAPL
jgi:hypothetical protein